jgi:hypothetical protein
MVTTDEGGLLPMHKGTDNIHHAIGDLVVIPKEMQWKLYEQVEQELAAWKMNPTIILSPCPGTWSHHAANWTII